MINELVGSPTRSENVYFANNEQTSIAVFTAVFCFTHAEHHLIKLKLYNNWTACYGKVQQMKEKEHDQNI